MGLSVSKAASEAAVSESVKNVLVSCTSSEVYPLGDALWNDVFATKQALNLADPGAMHLATRSYCSRMMHNNPRTRNLNTLLASVLVRLSHLGGQAAEEALATVNAVFLARTFLKYMLDNAAPAEVAAQLDTGSTPGPAPSGIPGADAFTAFSFVCGLIDFLSSHEPTPFSHDCHLEVLNLCLTLLSSQLRGRSVAPPPPPSSSPSPLLSPLGPDPFLELFIAAGSTHILPLPATSPRGSPLPEPSGAGDAFVSHIMCRTPSDGRGHRLVAALLNSFTKAMDAPVATASALAHFSAPGPAHPPNGATPAGTGILDPLYSLILLPWELFRYFRPVAVKSTPVADRSSLLLLLLTHNCRSGGWRPNPFRSALCQAIDDSGDAHTVNSPVVHIRMEELFKALCRVASKPTGTLLLYTLFHGNPMVTNFILSRTDLDQLIVPMLQQLNEGPTLKPFQRYMLLIMFLMLTQDAGFCDNVNQRIIVHEVPWFTDRILVDITLGSVIIIVLFRMAYYNLTHLQDGYMHTTTFAALANMSPHIQNIDGYAAQRMISVLQLLSKKYHRICGKLDSIRRAEVGATISAGGDTVTVEPAPAASSGPLETEETLAPALDQYAQLLHILLEIIHACLAPVVLRHNLNLVYAMIHQRSVFEGLSTDPRFGTLLDGILQVLNHFQSCLSREISAEVTWEEGDVLTLLKAACQSWRGGADAAGQAAALADTKFSYDEEASPEEFFVPYCWALTDLEGPSSAAQPAVVDAAPSSPSSTV